MPSSSSIYKFGPYSLNPKEGILLCDGQTVSLSPKVFETLLVLVQNCGHLVDKDELLREVWPDTFVEENSLARHISRLRQVLGDSPSEPEYIETVSKRGYRFIAKVQELTEDDLAAKGGKGNGTQTARQLAAVFCIFEAAPELWVKDQYNRLAILLAESKYLAQTVAEQYGTLFQDSTGTDQVFLFEDADAAVQFAVKVLGRFKNILGITDSGEAANVSLGMGCHVGQCLRLEARREWCGKGISVAQSLARLARPHTLWVTEHVLDLVDPSLYRFEAVGVEKLENDHVPCRHLYRVLACDLTACDARPPEERTAEEWFLKGASFAGTTKENGDEELQCYREALRSRPDYPESHNNLGVILKRQGDRGGAARHYREALRLRPDYPEAHYNYALLLESEGRLTGAATHYREAVLLRPDYVAAHHGYANLLRAKGRLSEAEEHYQQALRLRPQWAELHNNYAVFLEDNGSISGAEEHYQEAIRIRPNYLEAHYNYALLLERKNDCTAAEKLYRKALELWPDFAEAHNNLAILLHNAGNMERAQKHYEEAVRLRPDDPETHYNYALFLNKKGDFFEAREQLRIARELAPEGEAFSSTIELPE